MPWPEDICSCSGAVQGLFLFLSAAALFRCGSGLDSRLPTLLDSAAALQVLQVFWANSVDSTDEIFERPRLATGGLDAARVENVQGGTAE